MTKLFLHEIHNTTSLPKEIKKNWELAKQQKKYGKAPRIFECEPMFGGSKPDYLILINIGKGKEKKICSAYVYNGRCPRASEYGDVLISGDCKYRLTEEDEHFFGYNSNEDIGKVDQEIFETHEKTADEENEELREREEIHEKVGIKFSPLLSIGLPSYCNSVSEGLKNKLKYTSRIQILTESITKDGWELLFPGLTEHQELLPLSFTAKQEALSSRVEDPVMLEFLSKLNMIIITYPNLDEKDKKKDISDFKFIEDLLRYHPKFVNKIYLFLGIAGLSDEDSKIHLKNPTNGIESLKHRKYVSPMENHLKSNIIALDTHKEQNWVYIGSANLSNELKSEEHNTGMVLTNLPDNHRRKFDNYFEMMKMSSVKYADYRFLAPTENRFKEILHIHFYNPNKFDLKLGSTLFYHLPGFMEKLGMSKRLREYQMPVLLIIYNDINDLLKYRLQNAQFQLAVVENINNNNKAGESKEEDIDYYIYFNNDICPVLSASSEESQNRVKHKKMEQGKMVIMDISHFKSNHWGYKELHHYLNNFYHSTFIEHSYRKSKVPVNSWKYFLDNEPIPERLIFKWSDPEPSDHYFKITGLAKKPKHELMKNYFEKIRKISPAPIYPNTHNITTLKENLAEFLNSDISKDKLSREFIFEVNKTDLTDCQDYSRLSAEDKKFVKGHLWF